MKKRVMIAQLILIFLISCTQQIISDPKKQCKTNADCAPASCCHPNDAVNKNYAPDCSDTFCTMECQAGTIDCGQGEIKCVENQCKTLIY